jgi:hypothetical protein
MSTKIKNTIVNFIKKNLKQKHTLVKTHKLFNYYYNLKKKISLLFHSKKRQT